MDYKEFAEHPDFSSRAKVAEWVETAATVIVKLLARAEAAEAREKNLIEAMQMVTERAEKVERELQTAIGALVGQCKYCRKNRECTSRKGPHIYCWEWRGQKEA